jgi:hypothetical protein
MSALESIQNLVKALEAGGYNAAPGSLVQGSALMVEDLSPTMQLVTFEEKALKLQKLIGTESCKSTLAQFDRQLSYGQFGGSAQLEGNVGVEQTSDFVRVVVPMTYYSHTRRVTLPATMVATVDGKKADDRAAADAAKKLAGDIEFDLFRGRDDFSNSGVFDGNPLAAASVMASMRGAQAQIRESDTLRNGKDLMFAEYGSDESVVLSAGGPLTQDLVEDSALRSSLAHGEADLLLVDPRALSAYNKLVFGKERIILAGSAQESTGGDLRKQWVSGGTVSVEASQFLRGKFKPAESRSDGPTAPVSVAPASATIGGVVSPFEAGEEYTYYATTGNEIGESGATAAVAVTIAVDGDGVNVVITHPGGGVSRWFNVYRTAAGAAASTAKFIGRVAKAAGGTTTFVDIGNRLPGAVTGVLLQKDTMVMKELAPYSRLKLAQTDLSMPEAHFRFTSLAVFQPRKNVLIDNLR